MPRVSIPAGKGNGSAPNWRFDANPPKSFTVAAAKGAPVCQQGAVDTFTFQYPEYRAICQVADGLFLSAATLNATHQQQGRPMLRRCPPRGRPMNGRPPGTTQPGRPGGPMAIPPADTRRITWADTLLLS